jgi:hypothetical protein
VDCNTVSFEFDDEKSIDHCKRSLAKVLFKRFVPERMHRRFGYTLVDVLERIKVDTGTTLVMLQVDEYSKNQTLARALFRACRETFRLGPTVRGGICAGVLVVPTLSGIPFLSSTCGRALSRLLRGPWPSSFLSPASRTRRASPSSR